MMGARRQASGVRRIAASAPVLALLLAACGIKSPIQQQVTLDFNDPATVRVTAATSIDDSLANTDEMRRRISETRDALASNRDEWSVRFAPIEAMTERSVVEKSSGVIVRTERSITIPRTQLQRVFADTNITVTVSSRDGFTDLSIYPGASTRATRQQKQQVETLLHAWAVDVSRYLTAMHHLYSYLDRQPERAKYVFTRLLASEEAPVLEEEETLVEDVGRAADPITERLRDGERNAVAVDEQFDRVFNPFPAKIVVRLPRGDADVEGFEKKGQEFVIERRGLIDALESLNGRWLSPDPMMMLQMRGKDDPEPTPESVAAMPRRSTPMVSPDDIEAAIIAELKPSASYQLRWAESEIR